MKRARAVSPEEEAEHQAKLARIETRLEADAALDEVLPEIRAQIIHRLGMKDIAQLIATSRAFARPDVVATIMRELCLAEWRSPIREGNPSYRMFFNFDRLIKEWQPDPPLTSGERIAQEAQYWTAAYFLGSRAIRLMLTILRVVGDRFIVVPDGAVVTQTLRPEAPIPQDSIAPLGLASHRMSEPYPIIRAADLPSAESRPLNIGRASLLCRNNWVAIGDPIRRELARGGTSDAIYLAGSFTFVRGLAPNRTLLRDQPEVFVRGPGRSGLNAHLYVNPLLEGHVTLRVSPPGRPPFIIAAPPSGAAQRLMMLMPSGQPIFRGELYANEVSPGEDDVDALIDTVATVSAVDFDACVDLLAQITGHTGVDSLQAATVFVLDQDVPENLLDHLFGHHHALWRDWLHWLNDYEDLDEAEDPFFPLNIALARGWDEDRKSVV